MTCGNKSLASVDHGLTAGNVPRTAGNDGWTGRNNGAACLHIRPTDHRVSLHVCCNSAAPVSGEAETSCNRCKPNCSQAKSSPGLADNCPPESSRIVVTESLATETRRILSCESVGCFGDK